MIDSEQMEVNVDARGTSVHLQSLSIIRQCIAFSLAVKVQFVILTFAGSASLWAAIAAAMGASLLAIFNGLRLLR